jgi:hypothetical protein
MADREPSRIQAHPILVLNVAENCNDKEYFRESGTSVKNQAAHQTQYHSSGILALKQLAPD